jgi:glycosyltransferase involved in cell wall biosynthesis
MKLVLVCQGLSDGGAELGMLRLAREFAARGFHVRIAVLRKAGRLVDQVPPGVELIEIGGNRLTCVVRLAVLLRRLRPDAVFAFMTLMNVVSVLARLLSLTRPALILTEHSSFPASKKLRGGLTLIYYRLVPVVYRFCDRVICVSNGIRNELRAVTGLPGRLLVTVYNPVISPEILATATQPAAHPWLDRKDRPVLLAVGRLEAPKNYPLLLRTFAEVRRRVDSRLLVVGEGTLRPLLEGMIAELGLSDSVALIGFQKYPLAFMARADLFVLSSDWEGLSNVLIEALACGMPAVSTDAPFGPREVLGDGAFGRLVPTGDEKALADALVDALHDPGPAEPRRRWAGTFTVAACADRYLDIAGIPRVSEQEHRAASSG